ncbi:MAG: aminotransferase class V-fold PLP-dependent enzyme, partial [Candidatus Limnocylindrales bacterium]
MDPTLAQLWLLDPALTFLNHGSFGACPAVILAAQTAWRERMERDPVRFMEFDLEPALDAARGRLAALVGAQHDDLAFVANATTGVNTALTSFGRELVAGDEILTTDHEYNAVLNAASRVAVERDARLVIAAVPFPVTGDDQVVEAILAALTPRTRIAVISHVTSATAVIFPIHRLVAELAARNVLTIVDGAHAPGMVPVAIDALGAAAYAGNGHKWLCGPKGAGFLHVRRDLQERVRTLVTSHGANSPRRDRSRFRLEFDWVGTADPSAYLALADSVDYIPTLHPDGWSGVMAANHALVIAGRDIVAEALGISAQPLAPDAMLGSMSAVLVPTDLTPVPAFAVSADPNDTMPLDPLHELLLEDHRIQVPVYPWPPVASRGRAAMRMLRLS